MLMGSDVAPKAGLLKGNAVSLTLICDSEEEIKACYQSLSEGGEQTHPIEETHWGALFGTLTDKYGICWLIHYALNKKFQRPKL